MVRNNPFFRHVVIFLNIQITWYFILERILIKYLWENEQQTWLLRFQAARFMQELFIQDKDCLIFKQLPFLVKEIPLTIDFLNPVIWKRKLEAVESFYSRTLKIYFLGMKWNLEKIAWVYRHKATIVEGYDNKISL